MADQRKRLSELPTSTSTDGLYTLGVDMSTNEGVKVPIGDLIDGIETTAKNAKSVAESAKTAAGNAVTTANEAKTAATNAVATATATDELANTAIDTANDASDAALAAQTAANKAQTAADNAATAASNAQSSADNAQSTADDASTRAEFASEEAAKALAMTQFINAQKVLNLSGVHSLATVIGMLSVHADAAMFKHSGTVITFQGESGWETWQYVYQMRDGSFPSRIETFNNVAYWKRFGGSAAVGNTYNVTVDEPLSMGYYDLATAIATAFNKGFNNIGVQITFAIADKSWKSYQYIGADKGEIAFKNINNWVDLAASSAGDETIINIDAMCGACKDATYYTLAYAISALRAHSEKTGINYAKPGLIITYQSGEDKFETMQFVSTIGNFGEAGLWKPFGSGGGAVATSDTPEEGGKDAFSTGGAFASVPTAINIDAETEGVIKLALENAAGQIIGEQKQFAVGTGTGSGSAIVMEITPKESPVYGQAGGTIALQCAITLKSGTEFQSGIIEKVELYDRDSAALLETFKLNKAASADKTAHNFVFDVSRFFTLAGSRRFKLVAYDDANNTATRNINATAVDVTIKSAQTLAFTSSTVIMENVDKAFSLPMYRFPNNASDKGINCIVEIFINNEWHVLGTANVGDTFAHAITINPKSCCGTVLHHGAYPIRIHGEDVSSGVVGNYMHTAVMVVNTDSTTPIVVSRWFTEHESGSVKQYESIDIDFAAYAPQLSSVPVKVMQTIGNAVTMKESAICVRGKEYRYTQRVQGFATDGTESFGIHIEPVNAATAKSETAMYNVNGTLLDINSVSSQLLYDMDFAGRSNDSTDRTITDGGFTLNVIGANYTTNGFVKDSYGTVNYGTENDPGTMALRIAENVRGELNHAPFNIANIERNGAAIQFRIRTKHIADDDAHLISCIRNGFGFYVTGKYVVFTTDNGAPTENTKTTPHTIKAALTPDTVTDVAIVIQPTTNAPYGGIGVVEMYFDGEKIGSCYYEAGSLVRHNTPITFDGTHADLYLYNIRAWETHYTFEQAFHNYLLKLNNAETMISEYQFNSVMASQTAEGRSARMIPQMSALLERGIACLVMCKSPNTDDVPDNYPEYLEGLDGDKKTVRKLDWYFYFKEAWRNFIVEEVETTNQGTTSSWRPIKNKKAKTKKSRIVRMMYDRDYILANYPEHIEEYDFLAGLAAQKKVQIIRGTMPTNIYTIKVDYSESGGANNGASTNLYNDLTRVLGAEYMTPAQVHYTGSYEMNPCISSVPCALFRTDVHSPDATSPSYAYFHAKGNYNHDKGDAAVFGFEKVPGYNSGCLNYGDFYELIAARGQSLDAYVAAADKRDWEFVIDAQNPEGGNWNVIVISEYCGDKHRVFRRTNNTSPWTETTGTMTFNNGTWRITGDVVNPVENYELLAYNSLDWFQGVNTVDDMMAPDTKGVPIWMTYFESRYPDNDALNDAYEAGLKVPYNLFKWLEWCQQCNQHLTAADGDITINGVTCAGTPENRLNKFKYELHKVANVHSMICYHVFTDYIAAVDQRSKNMMLGFYRETDGSIRAYLNHLYDGDTILGSDNDCGLTISALLDPNNDPGGDYQGHDSVLFTQLAAADRVWLSAFNASDSDEVTKSKTVTVAGIAKKMREVEMKSGLRPFSPQGIEKYWITDRLSKYPKLVSSYDGTRKYIECSKPGANYQFALHGLSIQRLRDFVATRFRFRDGFYQCGDMFVNPAQMRCIGENIRVTITAAKDGFFGIGVDQGTARDAVYLHAGETYTLHTGNTNTGGGVMLYVFGADRIGELDLRNATPFQQGFDISSMTLLKRLIIGGADYTLPTPEATGKELSNLELGQMPFIEEIDCRNFPVSAINATYCPRLRTLRATGSKIRTFQPAQTSPISTLELPNTMTELSFVNLPNLKYGTSDAGLKIAGYANVTKLNVSGCDGIDKVKLLTDVVGGGASLTAINITDVDIVANETMLTRLMTSGVKGIGSDAETGCDGLTGRWVLTNLIDDAVLAELQRYFKPQDVGLEIHNAQFTGVVFDDAKDDPMNITNLENNTTGVDYTPTGHILRIRQKLIPVKGKLNPETGVFECVRLNNNTYRKLANGADFDYTDSLDEGFDVFMRCPAFWYKGVNDFKTQKKYLYWSTSPTTPISTAKRITRKTLRDILAYASRTIQTLDVTTGVSTLESENVLMNTPNCNVYRMDVAGMKQVRFPAMNSSSVGSVFMDADGVIIKTFNLAVANSDFVDGEYAFTDIPEGAVTFAFTSRATNNDLEAIAVDSADIEAIEPDWVRNDEWLGGVYQMSVDSLLRFRSLSTKPVRCGDNNHTTSTEWVYDAEGRPKNTPVGGLLYSNKDRQNLAMRRGNGYQLFDYEMSKLMALLWYSLNGTRDAQLKCGYGQGAGGTTGYSDNVGNNDTVRTSSNNGNKCLGFESFFGCTWEVMDNVAVNVVSYESYMRNKCVEISTDPVDAVWHIYDPITKTERTVQGITASGYCISRTKHGRFADIIASKVSTDTSRWALNYCDGQWYNGSRCRVVGRSGDYAYAYGGLAYANASYASSYAYSNCAARLAFRGTIRVLDE